MRCQVLRGEQQTSKASSDFWYKIVMTIILIIIRLFSHDWPSPTITTIIIITFACWCCVVSMLITRSCCSKFYTYIHHHLLVARLLNIIIIIIGPSVNQKMKAFKMLPYSFLIINTVALFVLHFVYSSTSSQLCNYGKSTKENNNCKYLHKRETYYVACLLNWTEQQQTLFKQEFIPITQKYTSSCLVLLKIDLSFYIPSEKNIKYNLLLQHYVFLFSPVFSHQPTVTLDYYGLCDYVSR